MTWGAGVAKDVLQRVGELGSFRGYCRWANDGAAKYSKSTKEISLLLQDSIQYK